MEVTLNVLENISLYKFVNIFLLIYSNYFTIVAAGKNAANNIMNKIIWLKSQDVATVEIFPHFEPILDIFKIECFYLIIFCKFK